MVPIALRRTFKIESERVMYRFVSTIDAAEIEVAKRSASRGSTA
jgi:hypothetical protein